MEECVSNRNLCASSISPHQTDMNSLARLFLVLAAVTVLLQLPASGQEPARHPDERDGQAKTVHRSEVMRRSDTNSTAPMRLWPLYSTPESRMNYVEVAGLSPMHFHP